MALIFMYSTLVALVAISSAFPWSDSPVRDLDTWKSHSTGYPLPAETPSVLASCVYSGGGPTATIDAGIIIGTTTSLPAAAATVNKFLGVPFAKTPPERFAPPESPGTFNGTIMATAWSSACIQQFVYPKQQQEFTESLFNSPPSAESEDCLYLNVYAPSTPAPADGRAVMYWIYGGSLQFGNAGQHDYDGSWFAAYQDVIVVTVNYRTNVFGFPGSPELPLTERNLGFLDQRFGLDWVQRNIAAFGGSPDKVTIFGESAGAVSVDALLTSFPAGSSPPFRGAIAESGQTSYSPGAKASSGTTISEGWYQLAAALECPGNYSSNLTCVKAAPVDKIRTIIDEQILSFSPVPDNVTLVSDPAARRLAGDIAFIPVLGGTNAQEGRVFTIGENDTTTFLEQYFGNHTTLINTIEAAYPLGKDGLNTPYDQISQIYTEVIFQCPQALWANATASIGIPAWRYYFNSSFFNMQGYPGLGVYHTSEIPLVFGVFALQNATAQEYALSHSMQTAWANFAKNPLGGPGWNQVGTGAPGAVLVGDIDVQAGGVYLDANGNAISGAWNLGVYGNRLNALGSGITVVDQFEVDYRCSLFAGLY